ncbi:phage tail tape measure protein [Mannheimia haemolytica]|uniref:phage tail tape measure protein n=2 Tax=Mannheimia haemolytica TaxID=75985 RepID=UPI00094B0563|nr:phage tail tape measure protein [Mannheimia haemolytica]HDL5351510.1 phage tail tape measure protein [Mannheimia haemolytica]
MSGLGKLTVTLELENAKFQSAMTKSDYEAQKFAKNFIQNMDRARNHAKEFADRSTQYLKNIEQAAKNLNKNSEFSFLSTIGGHYQSMSSGILSAAKAYTDIQNKMKLVSGSSAEAAKRLTDVFDIATKTSQSTEAVSGVYQTFAQNAQSLGLAQKDVAELTKTVSQAVAASGASSSAASNALTQFGQSLLMGKMKAQEFNSLITQTPTIIQAMAKGLGMTMAEFKAAVDDGKISTVEMVKGLKNSSGYVDELAGKMGVTLDGAMTNLSTRFTKFVGDTDKAVGGSEALAKSINYIGENIDTLSPILAGAVVSFTTMYAGNKVSSVLNMVSATAKHRWEIFQKAQELNNERNATIQAAIAEKNKIAIELTHTQSYIRNLQAQLNLATTEKQRSLLSAELQVQTVRETNLINAKTAAVTRLATAQKATTAFGAALGLVGGPLGALSIGLGVAIPLLMDFFTNAEQAKQKSLEFAQSLDQIKERLPQMTKLELEVSINDTQDSIKAQKDKIKEITQELEQLEKKASQTKISYYYAGQIHEVAKSAEQMRKEMAAVTAKKRELEVANQDLASSEQSLAEQIKNVPLIEMRQQFIDLYPHIDQSQIKVDGLNIAIGNFTVKSPEMVIAANNIANALGGVAGEAMRAAILVANLSSMKLDANGAAIIDPKHLEKIEQIERNNAIASAKGKDKIALQVKDALIKSGMKEGDAGYERLKAAYEQQFTLQNAPKRGGKPKKTKAERSAESYQNQVAEMTNRLSGLKIDKEDLVKYGGISQYQEVRKLTEDIALNAEKYKNYGTEGVAKLKELAAKIDSEQQLLDIEQFQVDHDKKLEAMQFELDLLGKTRTEKELLQFNNQLDLEAERLKINMTKENIALLDQKIAKIKEEYELHQKKQEETRASVMMGIKEGWNNIETDVSNVAANVANITQNTFDGMADSLTNFVMTGKADFRSFANSILSDLSKMIIKMMLFNAIKQGATMLFGYQGPTTTVNGNAVYGLGTWATGGYTGNGGKYTPAGIVHKGEYVITKEATSRLGLDYLNYLNYGRRGFASGGGVAVPRVPSSSYQPKSAQSSISVQVINNGEPVDAKVSQKQQGEQTQITVELMRKIARQEANGMIQNNFRAGGVFA